jgi:IS5 family transposase
MKMQLFEPLMLKFQQADWANNPEFGLMDTILDNHPKLLDYLSSDITEGTARSEFGRKDIPSVEQIVRAAIYKELKQLDYRELEYHQGDSRICAQFVKIDELRPYSFQMYQKYISRIKSENLEKLLVALNKIAIGEGLEDLEKLRQDSTVVQTNIHYPTNNALVFDCIKESHRLLKQLKEEIRDLDYRDYLKGAKRTFFQINVTKSADKRVDLFRKQLITFTKCINQVSNVIKKKGSYSIEAFLIKIELERLLPIMKQVYCMTERKQIRGESVPNEDKIFSIYEQHTDIIVKGRREVEFGHKINLATGKSNLILNCKVMRGNRSDKELYQQTLNAVTSDYAIIPRDSVTDGGYASTENVSYAQKQGIVNVVFTKVVGSLQNKVSSAGMETRLKKWRSGIEATISNIKRGFGLFRCNWKGYAHFMAKVMWSVIGYNIRVMTAAVLQRIKEA